MMKSFQVTGVGHALVDIIAPAAESLLEEFGLAKGTMRLTTDAEAAALYVKMGPAIETSGGSAANTCAGIASFGGPVAFMGKVGIDEFASVFAHDIRSIGVAFAPVSASSDHATGSCLILVTPDGERTMNTNLGAAAQFSESDVDRAAIEASQIVYLEGYLYDRDAARAAFQVAANVASGSGTEVAFTLSDPFCVDRHRQAFHDFIRDRVDIVFANEKELMSLYPGAGFEQACSEIARHCRVAAVTRSEKGSVILSGGHALEVAADPVERIADLTGAGDLYAAGFLFGLANGRDLRDCGRLASLAASEAIGHVGPRPHLPLRTLAAERGLFE